MWELSEVTRNFNGEILHRIKATKAFKIDGTSFIVSEGMLGGWVPNEKALCKDSWISYDTTLTSGSIVKNSMVMGRSYITRESIVEDSILINSVIQLSEVRKSRIDSCKFGKTTVFNSIVKGFRSMNAQLHNVNYNAEISIPNGFDSRESSFIGLVFSDSDRNYSSTFDSRNALAMIDKEEDRVYNALLSDADDDDLNEFRRVYLAIQGLIGGNPTSGPSDSFQAIKSKGNDFDIDEPKNVSSFRSITEHMLGMYKKKNEAYGDSFGNTFRQFGPISALTRMSDKWNRLTSLITNPDMSIRGESVEDTLMDLANYCVMTLACMRNSK